MLVYVGINEILFTDFEDDGEDESDGGWQQELQRRYAQDANFMAELRARHPTSPPEHMPIPNHQNYPQQMINYNHAGHNLNSIQQQQIHYPPNHSNNPNYSQQQQQQNYSQNYQNQSGPNQGPFGPQVGAPFR